MVRYFEYEETREIELNTPHLFSSLAAVALIYPFPSELFYDRYKQPRQMQRLLL